MSDEPKPRERFLLRTALCLSGPLLWALHFGAVYGTSHVVCATGIVNAQSVSVAVIGATVAAFAALAILFAMAARVQDRTFYRPVSLWLLSLSAFGVLAAGAAAIYLPACQMLR